MLLARLRRFSEKALPIPKDAALEYGKRLRQYERRLKTILWVGAGFVGLAGLVTADLTGGAPGAFVATVVTLIVGGGGAVALARIDFEWKATVLERDIHDADAARPPGETASTADARLPAGEEYSWPRAGEFFFSLLPFLLIAAATVYLIAVWWSHAAAGPKERPASQAPATAFLWFDRTWGRDDRKAFEREAFRHGLDRRSLARLYAGHVTLRRILGIAG